MSVTRRSARTEADLPQRLAALRPGDVFSIDRPITVEEFCEHTSDEWHSELVDGVVYVFPPDTDAHQALAGWLARILGVYVEEMGLGAVRGGRSGVKISRTSLREPDLLFFGKSRLDQMTARGVHGAPDLAIEIVDSAKARREAVRKQAQYEQIGVAELWVIDLPWKQVRHYGLENGVYTRRETDPNGELVARTIEGFHLKVEWLFQGPGFPSGLEVVQALLAEG